MRELIRETGLFVGCNSQEMEEMEKIGRVRSFKAGEIIFKAGSPADSLYVVSRGTVDLRFSVTHYLAERKIALDRMTRGEVFGWSAVTSPNRYTSEAVSVEDSEALQWSGAEIRRLQEQNVHLGYILMNNIAQIIAERFDVVQKMLVGEIQHGLQQKELSR